MHRLPGLPGNCEHPPRIISRQSASPASPSSPKRFRDVAYFGREPWSDGRLIYEGFKRRAREACELLERLMAGESAPATPIMIPPKGVVERESTNVLATPDRAVASALRYMWDNLEKDLSVEDIAAKVGMSGSQLRRRFRSALNRTVTEALRRKRLQVAKHLLRSTDMPIADLAPSVGFRSTTYLHRTFRAAFGTTPAQYRRARKT